MSEYIYFQLIVHLSVNMLVIIRHVSAVNNSLPQVGFSHKYPLDTNTCHQLYLVSAISVVLGICYISCTWYLLRQLYLVSATSAVLGICYVSCTWYLVRQLYLVSATSVVLGICYIMKLYA